MSALAIDMEHPPREYAATVHVPTHFGEVVRGDVFKAFLRRSGRPPPQLCLRRRSHGDHVTGTAFYFESRVVITLPLACTWGQLASLVAHELAHYVTCSGHDKLWREVHLALLVHVYGWDGGWPSSFEAPYGVDRAAEHFEHLLEYCPTHPAHPCSSRCESACKHGHVWAHGDCPTCTTAPGRR